MTSIPLYEIDHQIAEVEQALLDAGGEIDDETDALLDQLLDQRADKTRAYVALIKRNEATAEAYKTESERLGRNAKAHTRTAESLEARLLNSMQMRGETVVDTPLGRVTVRRSSTRRVSLLVESAEDLPDQFRTYAGYTADKKAIAAALKAGDPDAVAVAEFAPATDFLSIR